MTPIEQVRPSVPGNWTRRPEGKEKPVRETRKKSDEEKNRSGNRPDDPSGDREHHVDELA